MGSMTRGLARSVAKNRMTIMGIGDVNRKMHMRKGGQTYWRGFLVGKSGEAAEKAQMAYGKAHLAKKSKKQIRRERKMNHE